MPFLMHLTPAPDQAYGGELLGLILHSLGHRFFKLGPVFLTFKSFPLLKNKTFQYHALGISVKKYDQVKYCGNGQSVL